VRLFATTSKLFSSTFFFLYLLFLVLTRFVLSSFVCLFVITKTKIEEQQNNAIAPFIDWERTLLDTLGNHLKNTSTDDGDDSDKIGAELFEAVVSQSCDVSSIPESKSDGVCVSAISALFEIQTDGNGELVSDANGGDDTHQTAYLPPPLSSSGVRGMRKDAPKHIVVSIEAETKKKYEGEEQKQKKRTLALPMGESETKFSDAPKSKKNVRTEEKKRELCDQKSAEEAVFYHNELSKQNIKKIRGKIQRASRTSDV